ncbi:MAG TPA: hypothetical protein VEJ86_05220 [Candidatus Binataceae bacterium]|nr:hypothetical protein [Candidatus Binataceae bacterium]
MKNLTIVSLSAAALLGLASFSPASAHSNPGGLFDVAIDGYELVTESTVQSRLTIKAHGTVVADPTGTLSDGAFTISSVNGAIPESTPAGSVCTGTATGTIASASNQQYKITLDYSDSVNSGQCLSQDLTMVCNRHVSPAGLAIDLAAGHYDCVVTEVSGVTASDTTIDAASLETGFGAQTDTSVSD